MQLEYKCRRCGSITCAAQTMYIVDAVCCLHAAITGNPKMVPSRALLSWPLSSITHECADGGGGIADLIGFAPEQELPAEQPPV